MWSRLFESFYWWWSCIVCFWQWGVVTLSGNGLLSKVVLVYLAGRANLTKCLANTHTNCRDLRGPRRVWVGLLCITGKHLTDSC